jgi:glycosyltransferase involved in cell wall biosynthesis
MKAVPVIAYKTGGIPLQINHEVSGFLAPTGDTKAVANYMYKLLTDKHLFQKMSEAAPKNVSRDVLTVKNAIAWLWMANELTKRGSIIGNGKYIHDMISVSLKQ